MNEADVALVIFTLWLAVAFFRRVDKPVRPPRAPRPRPHSHD
jgi:hypothetical protein